MVTHNKTQMVLNWDCDVSSPIVNEVVHQNIVEVCIIALRC